MPLQFTSRSNPPGWPATGTPVQVEAWPWGQPVWKLIAEVVRGVMAAKALRRVVRIGVYILSELGEEDFERV